MKNMICFSMERKRNMGRGKALPAFLYMAAIFLISHFSLFTLSSCSEEDATEDEYANWQVRNEQYLSDIAKRCQAGTAPDNVSGGKGWKRLKVYSKDASTEGAIDDYIYAYVIGEGTGTECPAYTDSVRVSYQGRLIPTTTYPEGKVFDGTVYDNYSDKTNATTKFLVAGLTDGFSTALQHMHQGDHWRVYIPSALAYGETGSGTAIPGYSLLIFEITLINFSHAGQAMPVWSARALDW